MIALYDELRAIARSLDQGQIPYALVGGLAVEQAVLERKLRMAGSLRLLFKKLPHVPTPGERRLLGRFERFRRGQEAS